MPRTSSKEVADRIIKGRIDLLTEIIRTSNEESSMSAAMFLVLIGTEQSDEALMGLIRECEDVPMKQMLAPLLTLSQRRESYRAELAELFENIDEAYEDVATMDSRILEAPPLWQEIAVALDHEFARELQALKGTMIRTGD